MYICKQCQLSVHYLQHSITSISRRLQNFVKGDLYDVEMFIKGKCDFSDSLA